MNTQTIYLLAIELAITVIGIALAWRICRAIKNRE